ncbi:hypothetical protein ES689_01950 [Frigoribacterium sp. ACAM 257]|uniref:hypothetical protein n=1 Tax=Frigoribacterium sp. ACAM 257 TaxID=2508998 RepID=UPI0011B9CEE9|nr:hypothetical protein [Frigoribacterium sp. ACAM 257]TWX40253.1 hypothetical protein ES689_01950 [Frigoribacterium sp. ACAM 257]
MTTVPHDGNRRLSDIRAFFARQGALFCAAAVVVVAVHLAIFLAGVYVSPVNFDEAYVLQSPANLVKGLGWGSYDWQTGGPIVLFDPITSTGPTALVPVAASFAVFGVGIEQARWVMLLWYALFVGGAWTLGHKMVGRWAGLAVAVATLALNTRVDFPSSVIFGPAEVLGEIPAVSLILLAVLLLRRHPQLAGLALGLAAMAKLAALLAVPVLAVALLFVPRASWGVFWVRVRRGPELVRRFLSAVVLGLWVVVPVGLWEVVKLLGLGWTAYKQNLKGNLAFFGRSGSGVTGTRVTDFSGRIDKYQLSWFIPDWLATLIFAATAVIVVGLLVLAIVTWRRGGSLPGRVGAPEFAVAAIFLGYMIWWIFLANSLFARQSFPGMLLGGPITAAFVCVAAGVAWRSRHLIGRIAAVGLIAAWGVVAVTQTVRHVEKSFSDETYTRAEQVAAAQFIEDNFPQGIQSLDYWQNPELTFLSGVDSVPFPAQDDTRPLVLSPLHAQLIPGQYREALNDDCVDFLYSQDGFVVCTVAPTD